MSITRKLLNFWPLNILSFGASSLPYYLLNDRVSFFVWGAVFSTGATLNLLALLGNGLIMPVITSNAEVEQYARTDLEHCLATPCTRVKLLCDRIHRDRGVASIGDILMQTGVAGIAGNTLFEVLGIMSRLCK